MRSAQTASVLVCRNASGDTFVAQVRELDNRRTYLRRWPTREAALAACAEYIATGTRPPKQATGPKRGQRCPRRLEWSSTLAKPLPTAERLARIAAKRERQAPATVPLAPFATSETPERAPRANSAPEKPRTTWKEIYRLTA